jgi:hypothetical protein
LRYRPGLPTLALSALTIFVAAEGRAQQKKPATTAARPATTAAAGRTTTAPAPAPAATAPVAQAAPAPAPAPAPVEAKPVVHESPRTPAKAVPKGVNPRFGFQAAMAAPMSSLGKAFTAGFNAGAFVEGKPASLPVGLRGDIHYTRFPGKTTGIDTAYAAIQVTGAAVYDFPNASGGKSPFFATGGLGLYRWTLNGVGQTDFGQNLGLGFNFRTKFRPFLEGRFHFFNDVEYFALSAGLRL